MRPYFYRDRWVDYIIVSGVVIVIIVLHIVGVLRPVERVALAVFQPITRAVYTAKTSVGNVFVNVFTDKQMLINNLESEVTQLKSENAQLHGVSDENVTLRRQLGVQAQPDQKRVLARVIGEHPTESFSKRLLVDVGTREGISEGDPVVIDGALVGFVTTADRTVSAVTMATDPHSSIAATILSTDAAGIVRGDVGFSRLTMDQIDRSHDVRVGDTVVTLSETAVGSGILIGEVSALLTEDRDTYQTVEISPAAQFRDVSIVFILVD